MVDFCLVFFSGLWKVEVRFRIRVLVTEGVVGSGVLLGALKAPSNRFQLNCASVVGSFRGIRDAPGNVIAWK